MVGWIKQWLRSRFSDESEELAVDEQAVGVSVLPTFRQMVDSARTLPESTRRVLVPAALDDKDMLIGRDEELDRLKAAVERFRAGDIVSIAVIGQEGAGKTSLMKVFANGLDPAETINARIGSRITDEQAVSRLFADIFGFESVPADMPGLVKTINEHPPRIILLEDLHNLMLRIIGGRRAVETFLYVLLASRSRHLWVLTCRSLPWTSMDLHLSISRFVSDIVTVEPLGPADLRKSISARLEATGLRTVFCRSVENCWDEASEQADQDRMEDAFYRSLHTNSGGAVDAALYFLLHASRFDGGRQALFLHPPAPVDMAFVRKIDRMHQMTLAELASHGSLSEEEHSRIFLTTHLESQTVLQWLSQAKLLDRRGDTHEVSPVVRERLIQLLKQMNLLY